MKKLFCLLTLITLLTALSACGRSAEWTRMGNFEDENHNRLYITYSGADEQTELYAGGMIDGKVFGNVISQEGDVLRGDLTPEGEEGEFIVTLAEEGEDGLLLTVGDGGAYHFRPWEQQQPAITVHIDTEGRGQIAYADVDTGLAPEFNEDYPCTFAQLGLAGRSTFIFAAQADPGWKFVKWEVSDGAKATLTDDGSAATVCTLGEGWAGGAVTAKFEQTDPTPLPTELYWYDSDGTTELDMTADEALETEGVAETMEYMGEALANKDCHYAFTGFGPLQQRQDTWTEDGEQFTQTVYWRVAQYAPVLIHVEAKPATKTEAGIVEHWHCGECGTNYADAEGKNEIDGVMLPPLTCYQVSVASDPEAGGVVAGEGDYAEGETVTLTATAAEGYRFKAWKVTEGGVTVGADGTFAMPAQDVAATAQWTRKLTAVWLNGDGSELDRKTYWADEARPATDKKATKAQDAQYIYTFDKWDEGTVAGDVTIFAPVFAKKAFYTMEKGNNESYRLKSGKNQVYVLHRSVDDGNALTHLAGVKIGNTQLKLNADFTAVKGSVIITVKPAAMNKLKVGTQPVTISFDDGEVQTQVKILAAYDDQTGTGDNSHMFLWLGLMVMGCAGLLALRTQRKRWTER